MMWGRTATPPGELRSRRLRRNLQLLFWARALFETKALNAVLTLFYLARGVSLQELMVLTVIWSVTGFVAEIPTGYVADRIGRVRSLGVGFVCLVLASVIQAFAYDFTWFAVVQIASAIGYAFLSGADEALLYDTLKELGEEKDALRHNSHYYASRNVLKGVVPFLGALFVKEMFDWQFTVVLLCNALLTAAGLVLLWFIEEPNRYQSEEERETNILVSSIQFMRREGWLLRIAANKGLLFVSVLIFWRVYQPILSDVGWTVSALGVFYLVYHSFAFVVRRTTYRWEARYGFVRLANNLTWVPLVSMLGMFFTHNPYVLIFLCFVTLLSQTIREPLFILELNRTVASYHRATVLSNFNMIKNVMDICLSLVAGVLVGAYGAYGGVALAIAIAIIGVTLLRITPSPTAEPVLK